MKIETIDTDHAVGTEGHLLVCLWRTETSVEAIQGIRRVATRMARENPPLAMLTIVEQTANLPDADVRSELADLFKELGEDVSCSSLIFEGDGFRAAAVRGITTSLNLLARQPFPHKVFATVDEAATWMASNGSKMTPTSIVNYVASLRADLDRVSAA